MSDAIIDLKDIQSRAKTEIEARAYFTGKTVVIDDGTKKSTIEAALGDGGDGFCVVIGLPISAVELQDAPGVSETEIVLPIEVQVNPSQNAAQETPVNILEAIDELFGAILDYSNGANAFAAVASKPFELVVSDEGLLAYVCWFRKQIVLS
jgi:hypothetical protein